MSNQIMVPPEVLRFVNEVRAVFQDDREKHDQFFKLFVDVESGRIHTSVFITELKSLFQGHKYLLWEYNKLLPKEEKLESEERSEFLKAVQVALKDDYADFIQVIVDYNKRKIDDRCLSARVNVLLRRYANLISEFNTLFLPPRSHMTIPRWDQLPWDVLYVISRKLDFDDLFQFSRVCMNWRVLHKSIDELTSQEPLLLEFLNSPYMVQHSFSSIPNQKVYPLKNMMMNMLSYSNDSFPIYVTCSSGYLVIIADDSSFLLINPFTRIKKKVICPPTFKFSYSSRHKYRALLAFDKCDKCSEEFVFVFLFEKSTSLHVYRSRNNGWVTYFTQEEFQNNGDTVVDNILIDFVAFNNRIYVVTEEARIGVLSLNSAKIEFLKMVNSLKFELELSFHRSPLNLVKCDQQLLLVRLNPYHPNTTPRARAGPPERKVFKIDFSTMTYVKLETLGDIALFYVCFKSCQALSHPNRWGYESNSVYKVFTCRSICPKNPNCIVYNWDKKFSKYFAVPNPKTKDSIFDWYFRHQKHEVDCSL